MQSCMKGQVDAELYESSGGCRVVWKVRWMQSCMKGQVDAELYERAGGCRVV